METQTAASELVADPILSAANHAQRHAARVARARLGVEVWGWAIRNAREIPAAPLRELMDICTREEM